MHWVAELEVLTPVVVSSGEVLAPVDYAVVDGELVRVDTPAVLAERGVDLRAFEREVAQARGRYALERLGADRIRRHALYRLPVGSGTLDRIAQLRPSLVAFTRSAGRPYLPGSSVKGALRTALLASWLLREASMRAAVDQAVRAVLEGAAQGRRIPAKFAMQPGERAVFGADPRGRGRHDPQYDALRTLAVYDSAPFPDRSLTVVDVRVANASQGRVRWFVRPGVSVDDPEQATVLLAEALRPGTRLSLEGYVRGDLLAEPAVSRLRFERQRQALQDLKIRLQQVGHAVLEREHRWYRELRLEAVADGVRQLLAANDQEAPVLALGWGSGWRTKTVGDLIEPSLMQQARSLFRLGWRGHPFPKSRKLVFERGSSVQPLGWVALRGLEAVHA